MEESQLIAYDTQHETKRKEQLEKLINRYECVGEGLYMCGGEGLYMCVSTSSVGVRGYICVCLQSSVGIWTYICGFLHALWSCVCLQALCSVEVYM